MIVDFTRELVDLEGKVILAKEGVGATLGSVTIEALLATFQDEQQSLSGDEKLKRWELAVRIKNGEGEFTAEEVSLIKKLIGKAYTPIIVGQTWKMLEGK